MGRKKNEDRPIELQTSPINLRVSNEARQVLNNVPKYNRGKWLTERITKQLYTREELNSYATEQVKNALRVAAERANMVFESDITDKKSTYKIFCSWTPEGSLEVNKESILTLESELVNNIINEI